MQNSLYKVMEKVMGIRGVALRAIFFAIICIHLAAPLIAEDYLYFKNFVRHSDGSLCEHLPPYVSFIAYVNNDSKILTENSPRWDKDCMSNIDGHGVFGVELGNIIPLPDVGDSVFVIFTCMVTREQGVLKSEITSVPWYYFPTYLELKPVNFPDPPSNIRVLTNDEGNNIIRWDYEEGLVYSVYRTNLMDTLDIGLPRRLYYRIANGISGGEFVDSLASPDSICAYMVIAKNNLGYVSPHSREVIQNSMIKNLRGEPLNSSVRLTWSSFTSSFWKVCGYNIYRRVENESSVDLVGYTGLDTFYTDSRLSPGKKYFYTVTARDNQGNEIGQSEEIVVVTGSGGARTYTYANLKVGVVIYRNTNKGSIPYTDVEKIKKMLEKGRLFYWINSRMKLNIEFDYIEIGEYREFESESDLAIGQTIDDLNNLGVMNTQYDIIFRITPATAGYWSVGVIDLNLKGPNRKTGFSQSQWPCGTGVLYPCKDDDIDYGLTWIYVHECQHAIDALYNENHHPEMYHGDVPWEFPVACGEHFDFQAKMFRTFNAYQDLLPEWGGIYEAVDVDEDGFPDDDPRVPLDEIRFGSNPTAEDTDGDGLLDKEEAIDGIYWGSDPNNIDSDGDGLIDGEDPYPRYPVSLSIPLFTPAIDGTIESEWPVFCDSVVFTTCDGFWSKVYISRDDNYLYLGMKFNKNAMAEIMLDFDADGWWHSAGNTFIRIYPRTSAFLEFRSWDASDNVRKYAEDNGKYGGLWDDDPLYIQHFKRRVIDPDSVKMKARYEADLVQIEMAIPKSDYAGLELKPGEKIGISIVYKNIDGDYRKWGSTFDIYSFVTFELSSGSIIRSETESVETEFRLFQNYPNPFNSVTIFGFQVDKKITAKVFIYDQLGNHACTLWNGEVIPGTHYLRWDGRDKHGREVASGVYFIRVVLADGRVQQSKVLFLR